MNIVQLYIVHKTHCCKINIKQVLHVCHKSYNLIRHWLKTMLARSSLDVWELSRLVCGRRQLSIRDPDTGTAATTTPKMSTSTCWWSRSAFITGALFRFYHFPSFLFHSAQQCCVTTILSRVFSCLFVCSLFRLAFVFERHQMLQTRRKPVCSSALAVKASFIISSSIWLNT